MLNFDDMAKKASEVQELVDLSEKAAAMAENMAQMRHKMHRIAAEPKHQNCCDNNNGNRNNGNRHYRRNHRNYHATAPQPSPVFNPGFFGELEHTVESFKKFCNFGKQDELEDLRDKGRKLLHEARDNKARADIDGREEAVQHYKAQIDELEKLNDVDFNRRMSKFRAEIEDARRYAEAPPRGITFTDVMVGVGLLGMGYWLGKKK